MMNKVNANCCGQNYSDVEAAEIWNSNGKAQKTDLSSSPFTPEFDYRCNNERYWTYECMVVVQMEDCIDVLKVAYLSRL